MPLTSPSPRRQASLLFVLGCLAALIGAGAVRAADFGPGFKTQPVAIDGGTLGGTAVGNGPPVLLFHGYAKSSRISKPLASVLAPRFTVNLIERPKETIGALVEFLQ